MSQNHARRPGAHVRARADKLIQAPAFSPNVRSRILAPMNGVLLLGVVLLSLLLPIDCAAQSALEKEVPPPPVPEQYASHARPPSGIGGIVLGAVGLGLGGLNLVTIPVCFADFYPAEATDLCVALSAGVGAALVAVGIPSLIVGKIRRKRYKEWRRQQARRGPSLEGIAVAPVPGGGQMLMRTRF